MPILTTPEGKEIVGPTVHMNGTSREELLRQLTNASRALTKAMDALGEAAPHGRDYYVQPGMPYLRAQTEAIARYKTIKKVHDEIMTIAESI